MKKQNLFRILVLALALVMLFTTVTACDKGEDDANTTTTTPAPATTTPAPSGGENPPAPSSAIVINIVNGYNLDDNTNIIEMDKAAYVRIQANEPDEDKVFSHWVDKDGNYVRNDFTMRIKVWESNTYTAVYIPKHVISIINGVVKDTIKTVYNAIPDEKVVLAAYAAPTGFEFSHWEDSTGATVGENETLEITATGSMTYKAYYDVVFGESPAKPVNKDLATAWSQGGSNDNFTAFETTNKYRVSFAEPYLLKAGSTISVSLPFGHKCPQSGFSSCTTLGRDCTLSASLLVLTKNEGATGAIANLFSDYTKVAYEWVERGFTYTAEQDVYVMVTVKYTHHANKAIKTSTDFMQNVVIVEKPMIEGTEKVGNYWTTELEADSAKVQANRAAVGAAMSEFFFVTDVHWNQSVQYTPALIAYLADQLDIYNVVSGGDVAPDNIDEDAGETETKLAARAALEDFYNRLTNIAEVGEFYNVLATLGQSDLLANNNYEPVTYFDDEANKVRYIQFVYRDALYEVPEAGEEGGETGEPSEPAVPAIEEVFATVKDKITELNGEWTVVLVTHGAFGSKNEADIAKRVLALQGEADAEIAAWLDGGAHKDRTEVIYDAAGNKVNVLAMNSDSYANGTGCMFTTATEHSFSMLQIDTTGKKIYVTRVGAGEDQIVSFGQENITGTKLYS